MAAFSNRTPRIEILKYFLWLGLTGFGGPLAVIATLQNDLVLKRQWLKAERFANALALIKTLPGPTSTLLCIYLGTIRGQRVGGIIAGIAFILPSFLMMLGFAFFYDSIGTYPFSKHFLFGMQAVALGLIAQSLIQLSKPYRQRWQFFLIALLALIICYYRPNFEPLLIIGLGFLGIVISYFYGSAFFQFFLLKTLAPTKTLGHLAWLCFKAGTLTFGTGLAIVPILNHQVVTVHHWLSSAEFLDALAFGQITPGPVLITCTFIGYKVAGLTGALLATLLVFGPAFFHILVWFQKVEHSMAARKSLQNFVPWAVAAVCGGIASVLFRMLIHDFKVSQFFIGLATLGLLLKSPLKTWMIILLGGASAWLFQLQ